ncbi:MAG: hypothetical protein V4702_02250 [Patescibacteria group bacterium]
MSGTAKDTIYIDPEDEITGIIEKVRSSESKIVALVLPKRATSLQSIVNLKLLKRTTSEAKKNLVLITSDAALMPIAGAVGLHVAKTLQSKPVVPVAPKLNTSPETIDDETPLLDEDVPLDPHASIGQLAGHVAAEETIELDNDTKAEVAAGAEGSKAVSGKKSLSKKLKVPNFDRFRLLIFAGAGLLVLLIVGSIFAFIILPKAKITIKTDTSNVSTDIVITGKTDAKEVDAKQLILPATNKELKKVEVEKVPATGQRDEGTKATGTVTLTNCYKEEESVTIPAGSVLSTSANGTAYAFLTNESVTIPQSNFTGTGVCKNDSFKNVNVTAQAAGGQYNLSAKRTFSISVSGVSGTDSSAMAGGTSKIVQIVSQGDVDNAKQKAIDRMNSAATNELKTQFESEKFQPLAETFAAGTPAVTSMPNVNDPASEVAVTVTIVYKEFGVKQDDLKQIVEEDIKKQIDTSKQTIQDNGLQKAELRVTDKKPVEVKFNYKSIAVAGPQLDGEGIKKQIAGKKKGETVRLIQERPGIRDVEINYSPFWVFSTPKSTKKITITFDQNNVKN